MDDIIRPELFVRSVHRALEKSVIYYHSMTSHNGRARVDEEVYTWIDRRTNSEAYRLGFREFYDNKKKEQIDGIQ